MPTTEPPEAAAAQQATAPARQPGPPAEHAAEAEPAAATPSRTQRLRHRAQRVGRGARRMLSAGSADAVAAVLTWCVLVPAGALAVHVLDVNPLTAEGAVLPLVVGAGLGVLLAAVALLRSSRVLAGVAAGAYAAWCSFVLLASYHGTPFGDSGLRGDTARLTAMATRYTTTWRPVDGIDGKVTTEYPPLFPWLIARASTLVHRPAWQLVGDAEALAISLGVLVGFLLWRRLTASPAALVLAAVPPAAFAQPRKAYEIFALCVFTPWAISTFGTHARGRQRLHWSLAGLLGGVMVTTYQGFLLFAAPGLLVLLLLGLLPRPGRLAHVRHLLGTLLVAALVSAWYVVPFVHAALTSGGQRVNDLYVPPVIGDDPLGSRVLGSDIVGVLALVGLAGVAWFWNRTWWARPIAILALGAFAYRLVYMAIFVTDGHNGYFDYVSRLTSVLLASAGVLTAAEAVAQAAPALGGRVRRVSVLAVAVVTAMLAVLCVAVWMPSPPGIDDIVRANPQPRPNLAVYAHAEPLPSGRLPRYHPQNVRVRWLPVDPIRRAVAATLGAGATPSVVSFDERIYAYEPWYGWISAERLASNSFTHWDDRHAELQRMAAIEDPAAFAEATQHTSYGPIDVFVLADRGDNWTFDPTTVFHPDQFDPVHWQVTEFPEQQAVVAVRRPPGP